MEEFQPVQTPTSAFGEEGFDFKEQEEAKSEGDASNG